MNVKGDGGEIFDGSRISRNNIQYIPINGDGEILWVNLYLESSVQTTKFKRHDWIRVMGTVGGLEKFISMFILFGLGYFTDIDYKA